MINVTALGYNLTEPELQQVMKIMGSAFPLKEFNPNIIDLHEEDLEDRITAEDKVIIAFGKQATEMGFPYRDYRLFLAVPEPSELFDTYSNREAREYTWEKLCELRKKIDSVKQNVQTKLPNKEPESSLDLTEINNLVKLNPNSWVGRTKDGVSIRLSAKPEEGSEDIKLTFTELYALKVAMELLEITEFKLVPSNKTNNSSGH